MPRLSRRNAVVLGLAVALAFVAARRVGDLIRDGTVLVIDQYGWYSRVARTAVDGAADEVDDGAFRWVVGAAEDAAPPVLFARFSDASPTARGEEVCGLESAARMHPASPVVILTTASFNITPLEPLRAAYGDRIKLLNVVNLVAHLEATGELPALVGWYKEGRWRGGYPLNNLSNGLRIALVYLFGGRYFDMDILHVRNSELLSNAVVWENDGTRPNNAVLIFDQRHEFLATLADEFARRFDGTWWGANGPHRITETYQAACASGVGGTRAGYCDTMTVLPSRTYYPVHFKQAADLFVDVLDTTVDYVTMPGVYGVHLWSSIPKAADTAAREQSPLHRLAAHGCPLTLAAYGLAAFRPLPGRTSADLQAPPADLPWRLLPW